MRYKIGKHRMVLILGTVILALAVFNYAQHLKIEELRIETYRYRYNIHKLQQDVEMRDIVIKNTDMELDSCKNRLERVE